MTFQEEYEEDGTLYEIVEAVEYGDDELAFDEKKNDEENENIEIDYEEILEEYNEEEETRNE